MPRDYKSRASSGKKQKRAPVSAWVGFVAGLLVGLFITGLIWLTQTPEAPLKPRPASSLRQPEAPQDELSAPVTASTPEQKAAPKPRFDFYTILPEMEVVVPDPEPAVTASPAQGGAPVVNATAGQAEAETRYMLQMGSFRKYGDADKLKASLALVGIEAEIQKFTLDGGEVFHRVRSGPYSRNQVNSLRARLSQNSINSLVIKLKQ
ncbi:MAG: SPOR domain-containing protein [Sedimenticola sp.]|nr:SPOR domain-containing protein [Sedimenticola sp.]